jgi:hypothetical protein
MTVLPARLSILRAPGGTMIVRQGEDTIGAGTRCAGARRLVEGAWGGAGRRAPGAAAGVEVRPGGEALRPAADALDLGTIPLNITPDPHPNLQPLALSLLC